MRSFFYQVLGYAGSSVIYKGIGFLAFLWLAANMSVQAYATMGMLQALQTGITAFAAAGAIEALVGRLKHSTSPEDQSRSFGATMDIFWGLALIAACAVICFRTPFMNLIEVSPMDLVAVAGVGILSAFYQIQAHLIRLRERHGASIAVGTLPPLISLLAGVGAFHMAGSLTAFFLGMVTVLIVSLPAFAPLYVGWGGPSFQLSAIRPIVSRMPPFMVVALLSWSVGYGSTFLINIIFTAEEGARFTFTYTLSSALQLVATSLNQVWSPRFFKLVHQVSFSDIEKQNSRFYFLQGIAIGTVGAVLIVAVPVAIKVMDVDLLQHYQHLQFEMFCLFAVYAVSINWYHSQNYFFVHGHGRSFMLASVSAMLVGLAIWIGIAFEFGIVGAYIGFLMQAIIRSIIVNVRAHLTWGVNILWEGPVASLALLSLGVAASLLIDNFS